MGWGSRQKRDDLVPNHWLIVRTDVELNVAEIAADTQFVLAPGEELDWTRVDVDDICSQWVDEDGNDVD